MEINESGPTSQRIAGRVWRFADWELDELRSELRARGVRIEIEAKPLEVLRQLLLRAGEVVTKDELLDTVWHDLAVVDGSLATAVSKVRKALGDETIVVTVPRVGYRIAAPVTVVRSAREANAAQPATPPWQTAEAGAPAAVASAPASWVPDDVREQAPGGSRFVWWPAVASSAAVVALVVVGAAVYQRVPAPGPGVGPGTTKVSALAVLPLMNTSGDPSQDYLAEGLTEALITDLSKIRALRVISRTSIMQFKGTTKTVPEIARELHVDGVVEGSVLRSGDRVRVTAQLIQAATDTHLWAETYDRNIQDILSLQSELARRISREINITVQPSEGTLIAGSGKVDPRAHDLYLRGRYFWNRRTRDDLFKAVDYFRQATEADPNDSQAFSGLADAYIELVGFGNIPASDGIAKAKAAAEKAIALNESLAEPHTALGYALGVDWDWAGADREFRRALDLNPGYVIGLYQYGFFLSLMGKAREDEAIALVDRAVALDPLSAIVRYRAGRVYYHARHYDKAAVQFARILELDPADQLGLYGLGLVYEAQGLSDKALACLRKESLQAGFDIATAYATAGQKADARRKLAEEMHRQQREGTYVRPGWVAEVYAGLGEKDEAFRWLNRAYHERDAWVTLLKVWPPFDPLRSDPRFEELVRQMNFPS
ncbi:MAG TPA: winged helix-turn-helix domain-containing protein [Vicinamibacterales bacterium]|nr:winged helix-turn-helix domain-containing protein [Vicinamibacterales bacterium]